LIDVWPVNLEFEGVVGGGKRMIAEGEDQLRESIKNEMEDLLVWPP
jgi:hypothetical protein